jgi:hypothetical protein
MDLSLVPLNVQLFIAGQLSINDITILSDYAKRDTTKREHTALIRECYGYHDFSEAPWAFRLRGSRPEPSKFPDIFYTGQINLSTHQRTH